MKKKEWREKISDLKASISEKEWQEGSRAIHKRLFANRLWEQSKHITLYHSVQKEIDTLSIIKRGWEVGKNIYLPKCDPKEKKLIFYKVESFDQLEVVYYGIPEPIPSLCRELNLGELELVIVPGLVFDEHGYRIGYGGGYYDRFLSTLSGKVKADTLSLAFPFQVSKQEELPRESFDIPVDTIVTSQETISCIDYRV
jgi:5-formyltetrahydrofolate cyclo-ligase